MVNVADIMNVDALEEHIAQKRVNKSQHPTLPLSIYKYSQNAVIQGAWDNVTKQTRGLIVDDDGSIIARGFDKFFNLSEHPEGTLSESDSGLVMPKMDGSLGIVFAYDNQWHVATAGSFASDQAVHATALFRKKYGDTPVVPGLTLLVEIIYPENRIVTDYGSYDDLVLLGGTYLDGSWVSPDAIDFAGDRVSVKSGTLGDVLSAPDPEDGTEGFIFRADSGLMVKIKFPYYLKLHKARFSLSPKTVWRHLAESSFTEFLLLLPNEFHGEALAMKHDLDKKMGDLESRGRLWSSRVPAGDRGARARWINEHVPSEDRALVIAMAVSGRDYRDILLKRVRP